MKAAEPSPTEQELRRLWDKGDLQGMATAALRAYGLELYRFLRAQLSDGSLADDASSELWEDIWKGLPQFQWKCSFRTWAFTLARHAGAHALRNPHRRRAQPLTESQISKLEHEARTSVWRTDKAEDALAELRAELDEEQRSLLYLRVDRELGWQEVGFVLLGREPTQNEVAALRQRFARLTKALREKAEAAGLL